VACSGQSTIAQVADHIDHIKAVAGIAHVGYGSDFDGVNHVLPTVRVVSAVCEGFVAHSF
jgi:membrane dipeptidase